MIREVINELKKYTVGKKNTEKTEISVLNLNRLIFALEEQEQKTGQWIFHEIEDTLRWYECDQCGASVIKKYNYCPNCGTRMQEVGE